MRPLLALGLLAHTDQTRYLATPIFGESFPPFYPSFHPVDVCIATSLAKGENTNWVRCDNIALVFQKLPAYFAETKNRLPSPKDGSVQAAHKTEFTFFEYMSQPEHLSILHDFNSLMQTVSSTTSSWLDFYAFEEEIIHGLEKSANAVLLVDIAGGLGHKLQELRLKFPNLPGRLFLQDLPKTIESADNTKKAFETITHDFLIPQPIQGTYVLNPPFTLRLLPRSPN